MSHFKMSYDERALLSEVGKLYLFIWRTRSILSTEPLPRDLIAEYQQILDAYDLPLHRDPHTQINRLVKTILKRMEADMKTLNRHLPIMHTVSKGFITAVECSCGEVTKYKVPLKVIADFNCPKERKL